MAEKDVFVLGINGSPHKNGHGVKFLRRALAQARLEGARTTIRHLVDINLAYHNGQYTTKTPPGADELFRIIAGADALILSSPTRWYNVSDLMKNFLDHLTVFEMRGFKLEGKVFGLIATCEDDGGQACLEKMTSMLYHQGMVGAPYAMYYHNITMARHSENRWQEIDSTLLGGNVVRFARRVRVDQPQPWDYKWLVKL